MNSNNLNQPMNTAQQAASQEEFDYAVNEQDWSAVKLLVGELEQEMAERRSRLLFRISVWIMSVRVFKKVEDRQMVLNKPSARDHDYHKAMLSFLEGCGEMLLLELKRQKEDDPQTIGIEFKDFEACVADLHYAHREWYGDMTKERREEILSDVFGKIPPITAHS